MGLRGPIPRWTTSSDVSARVLESLSTHPALAALRTGAFSLFVGGSVHAQSATDPSVIDVAVFYTPQAKTANGWTSKQQAEAAIEALVTETNLAYTNSDVNQTIKLVAVEEVEGYIQATDTENKTGKNIDLDRLREPSDGYMDDVHTVRDRVWADIVMLLRSEGGGQAFMMTVLSGWVCEAETVEIEITTEGGRSDGM